MANQVILDSLLSNPFFADLEPKMVAELAARGEVRNFAAGEDILREGEIGDAAYVVDAGTVTISMQVRGNRVVVAERESGAFLGEISLLSGAPHTATVAAKTAVRALRISRSDCAAVISADNGALLSIIRTLGRRLYRSTVPLVYLSHTATALVDGRFDPTILEDIEERQDEIGRFTGIFESMARYVSERTRKLEATVEERTQHLNQEIARRQALEEELRALASLDGLTGIYNRRHFLELCGKELARSQRYDHPLALLMMDVDRFKRINDSYGHAAGDEVLKQLAATCAAKLRGPDILGRLGGEEFAVAMPECGIEAAERAAERLRRTLAGVEVPSEQGAITFTISIGVVAWESGEDLAATLDRADKAMYAAKQGGRDRVVRG
jgi:diguanylate cyclase (GGDEF)-like protein